MTQPTVSVIVVNYQRAANLRFCLWGLAQQDVAHELIVTDDGSTDDSLAIAQDAGATVIWQPHQDRRTAGARWRGAQIATGELLVFVDSDVVLAPWTIARYVEAYQRNPDRAMGGYCRFLPGMAIDEPNWMRLWMADYPRVLIDQGQVVVGKDPREAVGQMVYFTDPDRVWPNPLSLLGGNIAVPRHIYQASGGWDREMVGRGQDGEFSIRIAKAGYGFSYLIDAPGVHLAHPVGPFTGPGPHAYLSEKYPECYEDGRFVWPPRKGDT